MNELNLILTVPQGVLTATDLGVEGFARHVSPGSGRFFYGRTVLVDLAIDGMGPAFTFLDEGGWRDARADTLMALRAIAEGRRTKTALSNNAFSCTPLEAYRTVSLGKTGGQVMGLVGPEKLATYSEVACHEGMTPEDVAAAVGAEPPAARTPRVYMILAPVEFVVLSNLTPREYAWYATHRPGKIFRQVLFTELEADQTQLAAESRFADARRELLDNPRKKTKTVVAENCVNRVPFSAWTGYRSEVAGGLYATNGQALVRWGFPDEIPFAWEKAAD